MSKNTVSLFSNGMGHFSRVYDVGTKQVVSIPFDKEHIGDVAASLQVFGNVRLVAPASFTPSNSNATSLNIDSENALYSLLSSLSGASITFIQGPSDTETVCTLLGVETSTEWKGEASVEKPYLVVMETNGSISRRPLEYVRGVRFNDEAVQLEVQKALKKNFETIKPDSTFLEITLATKDEKGEPTKATVQYTVPVAAWKMRYAIRERDGKFNLEGAAVIDNNTDEDWNDFVVSVVTGQPISFKTDIAEIVVPHRKTVRIVDGQVLGNAQASEGWYAAAGAARGGGAETHALRRAAGAKMSMANYADFGLEAAPGFPGDDEETLQQLASGDANYIVEAPGVDSKEVGDFCVYTSKEPVTILARQSAVVPMFNVPLASAGVVLHYKESNNARRPYRAVKFKNETPNTLGRGKTTIYNDGVFSGECVLETTKPDENRTLPHCLENGVKIVKEVGDYSTHRQSVRIADGVVFDESVSTYETKYTVINKKDEEFKVLVEHTSALGVQAEHAFTGVEVNDTERIDGGYRVYFKLAPKETLTLVALETKVGTQQVRLGSNFHWINTNFVQPGHTLANDPKILEAAQLQKQLDELGSKSTELSEERQELVEQKQRVREDLESCKQVADNDTVNGWVRDLQESEEKIRNIDRVQVPALEEKQRTLTNELREALAAISVTWKSKQQVSVPAEPEAAETKQDDPQ